MLLAFKHILVCIGIILMTISALVSTSYILLHCCFAGTGTLCILMLKILIECPSFGVQFQHTMFSASLPKVGGGVSTNVFVLYYC